ncbi:MAG: hypothetical protein WCO23_01270 [bacterium]
MRELSKNLLIVLMALFVVLLDTSFFAMYAIGGVSLIVSLTVLIMISLIGQKNNFIVFSLALTIFLTIFSSLDPLLIIIIFFLIPSTILFLRSSYLPEPSVLLSSVYFLFGYAFLGVFLILYGNAINGEVLNAFLLFIILNSIAGVIFYYIVLRLRNYFQPGKQIKL